MNFKNNVVKRLACSLPISQSINQSINNLVLKKISHTNSIMKKNNCGFSLVEIMIAIGLLSGLSLVVMNLTKESIKSSTKFQFDSEMILITNEINGILADPNKCLTTFTNANQAAFPATPVLNSTPANVTNPSGIAGIPSTVKKYTIAGGPYGNGGVKITSYSLDLAATPDPLLTINFQKKNILGTGTVPKNIKLDVIKDAAGVITSCNALSSASASLTALPLGVTVDSNCPQFGAQAYDLNSGAPVYCSKAIPPTKGFLGSKPKVGVPSRWTLVNKVFVLSDYKNQDCPIGYTTLHKRMIEKTCKEVYLQAGMGTQWNSCTTVNFVPCTYLVWDGLGTTTNTTLTCVADEWDTVLCGKP